MRSRPVPPLACAWAACGRLPAPPEHSRRVRYRLCGASLAHARLPYPRGDAGFPPDATVFNTCITAWCSLGAVPDAERVLASMLAADVKPNSSTYTELIRLLAARGRVAEAEAYVVRARAAQRSRCACRSRRQAGPSRQPG